MNEQPSNEEKLRREFEALGRNLVGAMRAAWEAPESRRMREEVVNGLNDLGVTLKREADNLSNSQAAQQVRNGVEQVGEKLRTQEVQTKVRNELVGALQTVNNELQKLIDRWSEKPAGTESVVEEPVTGVSQEEPFTPPVQPDTTPYPPAETDTRTDDPVI